MASENLLAWTEVASGEHAPARWFVLLHGIYGRGRNWASVAQQVTAQRTDWGAILVDLRLHGNSPAMSPPHTIEAAANDVDHLLTSLAATHPSSVIVGHSFGGKVVLQLVSTPGDRLAQVWLIDSTPEARPPSGSAWDMLALLRELSGPFASRAEAVAALEAKGCSSLLAQWMATNLRRTDRGFDWALDLDAMEALLRHFFATDLWHVIESPPPGLTIHIVKATASNTLSEEACARILRTGEAIGRVHLHRVEGGHWLNVDNPGALVDLLAVRLPR